MEKQLYNLTNAQKNIWITEQYFTGTSINNICGTVLINEPLDFEKLIDAINLVVNNNDIFKLKFQTVDGQPKQYFDNINCQEEIINVSNEEELSQIENSFSREPFDNVENKSLFKIKLFKMPNNYGGIIMVIHHLLADSWTFGLICKELVSTYTSLINNQPTTLGSYSYVDHIIKEQEYMNSTHFVKDKEYWNNVFSSIPETATIPSINKKDLSPSDCVANRETFSFTDELSNNIYKFCTENKISAYNFFMAIYSIYISRVSNLNDFVIGTPILNRANYADKNTFGMFVSTVPLRIDMQNSNSFIDFLQYISQSCMSMLRHQKYPYQNILEDLRKKDSSIPNLYNIVLSYQITKTDSDTISCTSHWVFNGNSSDDLQIHIADYNDSGCFNILYDYKTSKYSNLEISSIHNRICHIIEQVLNNKNILVDDIEIVTEQEKYQLLYEFNNTKTDYPKDKTVIELFEEQVEKTPDNIAVVFEDQKLTYRELNEKANQLARYLIEQGAKPNDIIALCFNKNILFITVILATLKIGGTYLPISPEYPTDRINYILEDSNVRFIFSDLENLYINNNIKRINPYCIDVSNYNNTNIYISETSNLAYIIYTSGSTGKPKGVMLTHKNLINFLYNFNNCFNNKFSSNDNCLSVTSISFDVSICEIFTPLVFGSSLIIYPKNNLTDIPLLCDIIEKEKITFMYIPPSILTDVSDFLLKNKIKTNINKMLVGVESINNKTLNEYYKINENIEIVNGYGPTEATICSTFFNYKYDNADLIVPIGHPIANSNILITNIFGTIQPIRTPGEICIIGDNISNGYINNSALNKLSFVFSRYNSNQVMYKTGDIGYWDNNGIIHFIGRKDSQVKIKGHRIELNEINNNIKNIPGVLNSITIVNKINGINALCSYIILENKLLTINALRSILINLLPNYMVPNYILFVDCFELTTNGKIDKDKLPKIFMQHEDNLMPKTKTEIKIVEILENLLNVKNISTNDNFFDLGLDSLIAIKFSIAIYNQFGMNININDIFKYNNIINLSNFIDNNIATGDCPTLSKINKCAYSEYYHLSFSQKRIYYADRMISTDSLVYNTPGAMLINSLLDHDKVEQAFKQIIQKQSSFRTIFVLDNDEVKQKILDSVDFSVESSIDTEENIENIINSFSKPFNLEKAPLLRVKLCYLDNKKTLLLLDSHHIIMDGISLNILIKEFFELYNDKELEDLPIEYKDYSVWENNCIKENKFEENKKYWLDRFKDFDFESLNLPYDYTIPVNRTYIGDKIHTNFDVNVFSQINDLAKNLNISPYTVFLASLFITLYKYTGQNDIVIGSPVANRTIADTQDIIGMFVNNLAIRTRIIPDQTILDLLSYLSKTVTEDLDNQSYPYDLLIKDLNIPVDNSGNPLFDIVFTYQSQSNELKLPDYTIKAVDINNNTAKFNITIEVIPASNQINIEYRTDLFKPETISSFLKHYTFVLEQIIQNTNITVNDINIITENEQKLLDDFNNTSAPIYTDTVAKIFEAQSVTHPNDIAVICDDKFLTYKELNEKANSLANYLISTGIKPNDIVAIMTNRSLETIVCMIAILKAGAAFLNIDPTYPIERTEYYIEDSKIEHVLTQRELRERVSKIKNLVEIDLDNEEIYNKNIENPIVENKETDLSYIIYTSGSTGTPKGVMLNQIGLSNMVQAMTKVLDYLKEGNKHAIASVTSTPFDIFVYEIIVSLTHGLKVVMANNAEHRNPKLLDALIRKYNVDVMTVTPSLMKINYDNREPNTALANVKNMVFGGEPLPEKFVQDLKALANDITVYNIYGPSEITVLSNVQNLDGEKELTVGPPILNTQEYILDKNMKQVPIGVVGEIYIAGIQVGEGYIGKPELTAEKFLDNPFGSGKIYKSGDIGRWTFDGKIQCLGRIDNQVKLRGLRIELGEIEDEILKMDGVSSAIVNKITLDDKETLCAYYVSDDIVTENKVKENLRKFLPSYMVPTYIIKLEQMPYTINRKIDRKALPLPEINKVSNDYIDIATLDSNEEKLMQIWKNILKIDNIDVEDNFFDIGGDSVSAIKMQIEALKYGLEFEYADIFNFPTIKQLSKKLPSPEGKFMDNYDYSIINELLKRNDIKNLEKIEKYNVGNILLIGGTGYLGSHILKSFIDNEEGTIFCLIRQKNNEDPKTRLINLLNFYFGENYFQNNSDRIKVINGDITKNNLGLSDEDYNNIISNTNVVINAGALVKHFGQKKDFEEINVLGTQNVVNFCKNNNKRLLHTSTISISGFGEKEEAITNFEEEGIKTFDEQNLYIGQNLKGIYGITKYKGEIAVLEAINNGLDAQILRIGNITNRYSDGVFQKNINENAFARRIKSFVEIGAFPKYMLEHAIELTPVDLCADAAIKILQYDSPCNVFHIYDPNLLSIKSLYDIITTRGLSLMPVSNEMMTYILTGILADNNKKEIISGIVQDIDTNKEFMYSSKIKLKTDFTTAYLNKIGFNWVSFDDVYINKCFDYYKKIKFINKVGEN